MTFNNSKSPNLYAPTTCLAVEMEKQNSPHHIYAPVTWLVNITIFIDSLASINAPVSQSDMFTFLLAFLPSDYESFVTTAKLQRPKPTMAELRSSLLQVGS